MFRTLFLSCLLGLLNFGAQAQPAERSDVWWGHMWGYGMGGEGMMFVFWLIVLVLVVVLVRWVISGERGGRADAREILDRRFAKGEIDEAEYAKRKAALEDKG